MLKLLIFAALPFCFSPAKLFAQERTLISGAGPAGLVAALLLQRQGQDVLVVEERELSNWGTRNQVLGLSIENKSMLISLGVSEEKFKRIDRYAFFRRENSRSTAAKTFQVLPYSKFLRGLSGMVLPHNPDELIVIGDLEKSLLEIFQSRGGRVQFGAFISEIHRRVAEIEDYRTGSIQEVSYEHLINTEGSHSDLLKILGAKRTVTEAWPTLYFSGQLVGGNPAEIRYSLKAPGEENFVSTFFLTNGDRFSAGLDMRGKDFHTLKVDEYPYQFLAHIGLTADNIKDLKVSPIQITQSHLDNYFYNAQRAFVIGDAAHTVNPLTAYGINIAFDEAVYVANLLAQKRTPEPKDIKEFEAFVKRNVKLARANHLRYSKQIPRMTHGIPGIVDPTIRFIARRTACRQKLGK